MIGLRFFDLGLYRLLLTRGSAADVALQRGVALGGLDLPLGCGLLRAPAGLEGGHGAPERGVLLGGALLANERSKLARLAVQLPDRVDALLDRRDRGEHACALRVREPLLLGILRARELELRRHPQELALVLDLPQLALSLIHI